VRERLALYLGALGEPEYRRLFLGRTFSVLGSSLVPVALAFAILDLTGSATDLGLLLAARAVTSVVLLLVGGVWADRLPRNVVMLTADVARFGTQTTIGVLLLTGNAELWHFVVAMVVDGAANAFFAPASSGIVPHTVPPARLQQANALLGVVTSGAGVAGPAIAGLLVATAGAGWAFTADGVTYLVSAFFLARMRLPRALERAEAPNFVAELRQGWREFRAQTWMVAIDFSAIVANATVVAAFLVLGPLVSERELGGAASWATIATGFALGAVAGEVAALIVRVRRPLVLACSLILVFSLPIALLAIPAPTLAIAVAALLAGGSLTLFNTLFVTTMQEQVPEEALARVSAYDWLASVGFMPLGFAIVGPLADAFGVKEILWTFAATHVVIGAAVLMVPAVRRVERRGVEPSVPEVDEVAAGVQTAAASTRSAGTSDQRSSSR
jgi:MFS family permease